VKKAAVTGAINIVDIQPIANGLLMAYQEQWNRSRANCRDYGYCRHSARSNRPNETLRAQIIKSNNASGRLKTMQHDVVNFATALLQIKAQIICKHFTDDTIIKISGAMQLSPQDQALIPQALQLLKDGSEELPCSGHHRLNDLSRRTARKADRMEFLQGCW